MEDTIQKFTAALAVLALIGAGVGAVTAAPGSIDGTQTDTTDEVYITDGKTMDANFNASGDTTWNLTVQSVPDTADLAMNVSYEGETYYEFTGTFSDYNDSDPDATATTTGEYHTFTDDELSRVPMAINQNVTLNVTYWNSSAANPTPTTVQVFVENTDERSVQRVTENASTVDVETKEPPMYRPLSDDYEAVSVDSESVDVNGSVTDITYTLSDNTVQNPFANRTESLDSDGFTLMMASVDADSENPIPVFLNSAPDWYDSEDMGTYAVYDSGDDTITVMTEDSEFEGASSADVSMSSDVYRAFDVGTVWDLAGGTSGEGVSAILNMVM